MSMYHWMLAFSTAVSLHLIFALLVFGRGLSGQFSAIQTSQVGIEVELGTPGTYTDMIAWVMSDSPSEALETKPVAEPVVEPVPVPVAEPKVKPLDPPVAKIPAAFTPTPPPQPKLAATPKVVPPEASTDQPAPAPASQSLVKATGATATARGSRKDIRRNDSRASDSSDYFLELMAWLNRYKEYPIDLKKKKKQGVVTVQFSINKQGEILDSGIIKSSGLADLDAAAIRMLKQANPLPGIPDSLQRDQLTLAIPIEYSLITD